MISNRLMKVMSAPAPAVDTLKQVLNQRLQKLRPDGFTERNVLFENVRAGKGSGDYPLHGNKFVLGSMVSCEPYH